MNNQPAQRPLFQLLRSGFFSNVGARRYDDAVRVGSFERWRIDERKLSVAARMAATAIVRKSSALRLGPYGVLSRLAPDGYDRVSALHGRFDALAYDELARARALADLIALASVLDVDPGPAWRMRTRTGALLGGQDANLVVAYGLFANGAFSREGAKDPLRVDASMLASVERSTLDVAFASIETPLPERLDDRLARLRAVGAAMVASDDPLQRLGAAAVDAWVAPINGRAVEVVPFDSLLADAVRRTSAAGDDRSAPLGNYLISEHDARYLELAWSWAALLPRLGACLGNPESVLLAPDRWSVSLLVDTGVFAPASGTPPKELVADPSARVELASLVPFALDALCVQVRALIKCDELRLPKQLIAEWGTIAAGRALSARDRPGGLPLAW